MDTIHDTPRSEDAPLEAPSISIDVLAGYGTNVIATEGALGALVVVVTGSPAREGGVRARTEGFLAVRDPRVALAIAVAALQALDDAKALFPALDRYLGILEARAGSAALAEAQGVHGAGQPN